VLTLTVVKVPAFGAVNSTFDVFRLKKAWGEGNKIGNSGSPAATGEATWTAAMLDTEPWTEPGAKEDAVATASASTPVGSVMTWSGPGIVADAQFWLANPGQNFGWLLTSQSEGSARTARGFASRENGFSAPPTLRIGYKVAATRPVLSIGQPSGATVRVSWTGGVGPFVVQRNADLSTASWVNEGQPTTDRSVNLPMTGQSGFFRVLDTGQ
jgi:hypothetical protein